MANSSEIENRRSIHLRFRLILVMCLILAALSVVPAQASTPQATCTNKGQYVNGWVRPFTGPFDVGQRYERILQFRNTGSCIWNSSYRFVKVAGPETNGDDLARVRGSVRNGQIAEIWIPLAAPTKSGEYSSRWQLRAPDGTVISQKSFGIEVKDITMQTLIGSAPGFGVTTLPNQSSGDSSQDLTNSGEGSPAAVPDDMPCIVDLALLSNETNPSKAAFQPGESFSQIVRYRNDGNCAWDSGYHLVNISAAPFEGRTQVALSGPVEPNGIARFVLQLQAPSTPGEYENVWEFEMADQIGLSRIPVNITVAEPSGAAQPSSTSTGGSTSQASVSSPADCSDDYQFVKDVTIPDGTRMVPGEPFEKIWRYRNTGTCTWDDDYQVSYYSGHRMSSPLVFSLPHAVLPGETVDIAVDLIAPFAPGEYKTRFHLHAPDGAAFSISSRPFVEIIVEN